MFSLQVWRASATSGKERCPSLERMGLVTLCRLQSIGVATWAAGDRPRSAPRLGRDYFWLQWAFRPGQPVGACLARAGDSDGSLYALRRTGATWKKTGT